MILDNFKATKAGVCPLWIKKIFFHGLDIERTV